MAVRLVTTMKGIVRTVDCLPICPLVSLLGDRWSSPCLEFFLIFFSSFLFFRCFFFFWQHGMGTHGFLGVFFLSFWEGSAGEGECIALGYLPSPAARKQLATPACDHILASRLRTLTRPQGFESELAWAGMLGSEVWRLFEVLWRGGLSVGLCRMYVLYCCFWDQGNFHDLYL